MFVGEIDSLINQKKTKQIPTRSIIIIIIITRYQIRKTATKVALPEHNPIFFVSVCFWFPPEKIQHRNIILSSTTFHHLHVISTIDSKTWWVMWIFWVSYSYESQFNYVLDCSCFYTHLFIIISNFFFNNYFHFIVF